MPTKRNALIATGLALLCALGGCVFASGVITHSAIKFSTIALVFPFVIAAKLDLPMLGGALLAFAIDFPVLLCFLAYRQREAPTREA